MTPQTPRACLHPSAFDWCVPRAGLGGMGSPQDTARSHNLRVIALVPPPRRLPPPVTLSSPLRTMGYALPPSSSALSRGNPFVFEDIWLGKREFQSSICRKSPLAISSSGSPTRGAPAATRVCSFLPALPCFPPSIPASRIGFQRTGRRARGLEGVAPFHWRPRDRDGAEEGPSQGEGRFPWASSFLHSPLPPACSPFHDAFCCVLFR